MIYKREEVFTATLNYFNGDVLATNVWIDKYCLKNNDEFYELTPSDMHRRLAKEFARIEQKYPNPLSEEEIYDLLKDFKYIIPQGSPMAGIGNDFVVTSLSNCFVISNKSKQDSYGGIMRTDEELVQLMKRRGGVGTDLSHLRPSGALAGGTKLGVNAGMTLYMERFSNSTREVQQDGRRGALMLSLDVRHPDIEKFIDIKLTEGKVTGANISVKSTDQFINAAIHNEDFILCYPITLDISNVKTEELTYDILTQIDGGYVKKIKAKRIWDKLIYNSWKSAEPGLLIWSKILSESPFRGYGEEWEEESTNPCGELPLCKNDSCRLLILNLYSYIIKPFTKEASFDFDLFQKHTKIAQRLMDDIIDLEIEKIDKILEKIKTSPEKEDLKTVEFSLWTDIRKKAISGRRTGLGITAEGDMIAAIGLQYGTKEATDFSEKIHKLMASYAYISTIEMAKERGAAIIWDIDKDKKSDYIKRMFYSNNEYITDAVMNDYKKYGRRNIGLLTAAPTGTTSLMTQTTSGIEPLFSAWYFRKKKTNEKSKSTIIDEVGDMWEEFAVFHKQFIKWYSINNNITFIEAETILVNKKAEELDIIFTESPYYKATAQDIDYIEKVRMQGSIQKWVDHSISVTVNMPSNVTVDTVANVYKTAWETGCKGVTVYRDGSRAGVLTTKKTVAEAEKFEYISAIKRPKVVKHDIYVKTVAKEEYIIFVGIIDEKPYEIFAIPYDDSLAPLKHAKHGTITKVKSRVYKLVANNGFIIDNIVETMNETERNQTRDFSTMLRHRIDPKFIVHQIKSYATISSFQKIVGRILELYIEKDEKQGGCPECGGKIIYSDGCMKCIDCGYGKCS